MEVKTGMTLKPGGDFGVLGGRIVFANNVKLQLGGDFLVDLAVVSLEWTHRFESGGELV